MKAHGFKVREAWLPLVFFNLQSGLSLLLITWTIAEQLEHAAAAGTTRYLVAGESCQVQTVPLPGHLAECDGLQYARSCE